jgi:hypothetical protein
MSTVYNRNKDKDGNEDTTKVVRTKGGTVTTTQYKSDDWGGGIHVAKGPKTTTVTKPK